MLAALEDKVPIRRAVAAEALCRASNGQAKETIAKLLQDPKPAVRLRIAIVLADLCEEKAVTALIALLEELPPSQARQAENYLMNLFGETGPKIALGTDQVARRACRAAWTSWWGDMKTATLLDEFRKRTLTDADREKVQELIKQLGNESFEAREKALTDLQSRGAAVAAMLRQAVNDPDPEVSFRAGAACRSSTRGRRPRWCPRPSISSPCASPPMQPRCSWPGRPLRMRKDFATNSRQP